MDFCFSLYFFIFLVSFEKEKEELDISILSTWTLGLGFVYLFSNLLRHLCVFNGGEKRVVLDAH